MRAEALHNICSRDCNYLSSTFHFVKFAQSGQAQLNEMSTIAVPVIENLRPFDVPMIKNGPSMYRLKQVHPSMYRIFEKKRDPLMYLAA